MTADAMCCFYLRASKRCAFVIVSLFVTLILGYLSYRSHDHWRYPPLSETTFLMRPDSKCDSTPPFLVVLVTSTQHGFKARSAIRQTWGGKKTANGKTVVTYFLLGYNWEHQAILLRENLLHKDMIQKDFADTYYNLTTKVLMGLEWMSLYCPSATFVMKTDSDMFVNVNYLVDILSQTRIRNIFTGFIIRDAPAIRDKSHKWYVSEQEYPLKSFPPYCSGSGYILSTDVASRVWRFSKNVPKLKLEDVFIGICLAELKLSPVELHHGHIFNSFRVPFSACTFRKLVTSHAAKPYELFLYWDALADEHSDDCPEQI